jgi:hypothetical protein
VAVGAGVDRAALRDALRPHPETPLPSGGTVARSKAPTFDIQETA